MKKILHTAMKLLLVFAIFFGLQGRVIIRYVAMFHKVCEVETTHKNSHGVQIRAAIKHCKLQCYTQHFQPLNIPAVVFMLVILLALSIPAKIFILYDEDLDFAEHVRLLPLRAPPVL